MAKLTILKYPDPRLHTVAKPVAQVDARIRQLADDMLETMYAADGVGLAATQVGIVRRVFVFNDEGEDRIVVNPVLTVRGKDTEVSEEGCLSLGPVRMPVERALKVTLDGVDVHGEPLHLELEGLSARVVQHETDHLDGTLIIDRTDPESRREAMAQLRPRLLLSR
jgi:peptide deformylase